MQTDRTRLGDLNTFNMQHGYMEALVRGYRSGFLSESEYRHLAQCETIDGIQMCIRDRCICYQTYSARTVIVFVEYLY